MGREAVLPQTGEQEGGGGALYRPPVFGKIIKKKTIDPFPVL